MCYNPLTITISEPNATGGIRRVAVPCGKCFQCLRDYQNAWSIRIQEEFKNYGYGYFFTLTYNNSCVPFVCDRYSGRLYQSVCKSHVQDWIKRFRTRLSRTEGKTKEGIKYFITSEYGPRTLRPHYHGVIFGVDDIEFRLLLSDWNKKFGFTTYKLIPAHNCGGASRYVAKYCSKGFFKNPYEVQGIVKPTFHLVSKGFGLSYVTRMKDYHLAADCSINPRLDRYYQRVGDRSRVYVGKFGYKMPRYYKTKIYGEKTRLSHKVADYLHSESDKLRDSTLARIQSERNCTLSEAIHILDLQNDSERLCKEREIRKTLGDSYDKSQI